MKQAGYTAFCVAAGGANLVIAEFIAGDTIGFYLQEMIVAQSDANAGNYWLRRTLTRGLTPVLGNAFPYRSGETIESKVAVSWATRPLAATGPVVAAFPLPATIGASLTVKFAETSNKNGEGLGIFVPPGTSLSLFSFTATGAPYVICKILEM